MWSAYQYVTKKLFAEGAAREFVTNTVLAMAAFSVAIVIEKLVLMPYLGQRMSASAFGELLLIRNWVLVLASGVFAGLHNLLLRRNLDWVGVEKASAVRSAALLGAAVTTLALLIAFLAVAIRQPEWLRQNYFKVLAFGISGITNTVYFLLQTYWRMQFRMRLFYALQATNGLALLLVIPGYRWKGEIGAYAGWLLAGMCSLVITLVLARCEVEWRAGHFMDRTIAHSMLQQMWVFVWGVIGQALLQNMDRFVIGSLMGAAAVATYFKATNTAYMVLVPVEPLSGLLLSMVAQQKMDDDTMAHWRKLHGLMFVVMGGAFAGGALLGPKLTDVLYGAGTYSAHSQLFWMVLVGCTLAIVSTLLRGMLIVYVQPKWLVGHDTATILFLLVVSIPLIFWQGLFGAALAVAVTLGFRAVLSELVIFATLRKRPE
jgi:O-antigen/teichoic acid export membrane protein